MIYFYQGIKGHEIYLRK